MKLLLLRHGIAQDRALEIEDKKRKLTEEGKNNLRRDYPSLALFLRDKKVRVISSGLVRADETAEILKEYLKNIEIEKKEFVGNGDFNALKETFIESMDTYDYLAITGHSPYMEEWLYETTCHDIAVAKGSALEIEITNKEDFSGKLNWYIKPGDFKKLEKFIGKEDLKNEFNEAINNKIDELVEIILKHREIYIEKPEEVESVHKLRVKIRQFRSFVSFLKPMMKKKIYKELQDVLRSMAQECAYLRELDVLIKEWMTHEERYKKEGVSGEEFLKVLKKEREIEEKRLLGVVEKPSFAWDLDKVVETLKNSIDTDKTDYITLDEMLNDTLRQWHDRIKTDYEAIETNNLGIIHALRIKAKKMRYMMEIFGLDKEESTKEMYQEIRKWQEVIGEITDANRNSEAVNEIVKKIEDSEDHSVDWDLMEKEVSIFNDIQRENADELYMEFFGKKSHEVDLFAGL